jgi:hypothetical protein
LYNLREEQRLTAFENKVHGRIFGPRREEITGRWKQLRNKGLHNLSLSPNYIRVIGSKRM